MVTPFSTAAKIVLAVTIVLSSCMVSASSVHARTADIVVGPPGCGDEGYLTDGVDDNLEIQAALVSASNGDVIQLCEGRYEYAEDVLWSPSPMSVTLRGAGIGKTVLDGNSIWNLLAVWASALKITVEDLTLKDSYGGWGSAVLIFDIGAPSSLTLNRVAVTGGRNPFSYGAVAVEDGSITIRSCLFDDNDAYGPGGAVYASNAVSIMNSTFTNNRAHRFGGAVSAHSVQVANTTFDGNYAGLEGGAIFSQGDSAITGSRFMNNSAGEWGGALSLSDKGLTGTSSLVDTVFTGNSAKRGGAIDSWGIRLYLQGVTFDGNHASIYGGAISRSGRTSSSDLGSGNRFAANTSVNGNDVALYYTRKFTKWMALRDARVWSRLRVDIQVVAY